MKRSFSSIVLSKFELWSFKHGKKSFSTKFCMYKLVWILLFSLVMLLLIFDQFGGISVSLVDHVTLKLIKYFFSKY